VPIATNLRPLARSGLAICAVAFVCGCAPTVRFEPGAPAWEARPGRACPRVESLGAVDLGGGHIVATGCTAERPCLLVADAKASSVHYVELSLPGLQIVRQQPIPAPSELLRGELAATLTDRELVIVSGRIDRIYLAGFTTSGELRWQAEVEPLQDSHWQRIQVIGDDVALLFQHHGTRLALFGRDDGVLRRAVDLGAPEGHWHDGCITQADGRLFAAWLGDLNFDQSYDRRPTVESAWIDPATGEVRRGERQTAQRLGRQLVCAPHGREVGVAILGERDKLHFSRIGPDGTTRALRTVTTMRSRAHNYGEPQLLASDDGFAAAWGASWSGHDDQPPREFVTFLDLDGRRTRIVELGKHTTTDRLLAGPRGPTALYRSSTSSEPWSVATLGCER
jgi:hypothetical protein